MGSNKVILTGDWHLGKRQYGLKFREMDRYKTAWEIIHYAVKNGVKAILNAGDLLDVVRPTSRAINELMKIHNTLVQNDIPMLVVQGNHDKTNPPWFELFNSDTQSGVVLADNRDIKLSIGDSSIKVSGVPEQDVDSLKENLQKVDGGDILMTHISVRDWIGFPSETALSLADIPANKWEYVLIGDTHVTEVTDMKELGFKAISPGSIELGDKAESRDKSFFVLDVDTKKIKKEKLVTRPAVNIRVETEEEVEAGLKEIAKAIHNEAMIFLTYNPFIPGFMARVDEHRKDNNSYIIPEVFITEDELFGNDELEFAGDEILEIQHFACRHTNESDLVKAFERIVDSSDSVADIVQFLEEGEEDDAVQTRSASSSMA